MNFSCFLVSTSIWITNEWISFQSFGRFHLHVSKQVQILKLVGLLETYVHLARSWRSGYDRYLTTLSMVNSCSLHSFQSRWFSCNTKTHLKNIQKFLFWTTNPDVVDMVPPDELILSLRFLMRFWSK